MSNTIITAIIRYTMSQTRQTQEENLHSEFCSQGIEHEFDDRQETTYTDFPSNIEENTVCSKCEKVCEHEILIEDPSDEWIFENCTKDECAGSETGHEWSKEDHEYCSPDQYEVFKCDNCEGEKTVWYHHKKTLYSSCENGKVFHVFNMPE